MNENENKEIPKASRPLLKEILICLVIILFTSLAISLLVYFLGSYDRISHVIEITYSKDKTISFEKDFFLASLGFGLLLNILNPILFFIIKPSGIKAEIKKKNIICLSILTLFGYLAFLVLNILLSGFGLHPFFSSILTSLLVSVYDYLIYKLYMENRTYSNHLFWELLRFAIVGLVAAVFDFLVCFVVQFVFFKNIEAPYVTIISTICGFLVGVIINYLMSTYMVYKASKSTLSKSFKGVALFVILSAIGLGIGIGLQYFLYDFLFISKGVSFFSYPIDFVIRTLLVMVYNYITRKLFIYR